jgi:hypothetical protein
VSLAATVNLRRVPTVEQRCRMSEAQKRRGAWPPAAGRPWTEAEDAVVRSLRLCEAVKVLTGRRTPEAVRSRRMLKMPDGRSRNG